MMKSKKSEIVKLPKELGDPKYKGKHLLWAGDKFIIAGNWKKVSLALEDVYKSGKVPTLAYMPKADTLILFHE